ncbi:nicotinate phosphoribosyltransferase [Apophysomyces sp. BC1034]|nr:nicotinate phosphoribosyltransferase [Apophysomyces sp. BC1015]KAG0179580.1 nicotinate phosphoribosyltransferase [Apophysomyces sp. BC1021]KAG0189930.1 nicotinate phosphoribosyltransferase [Apophysomyces sp. BC1034]
MSAQHGSLASILDNDLYKFTMQYAVLKHYKDARVVCQFTNREKELRLNAQAFEWLLVQIRDMEKLSLTVGEREYMTRFAFFDESYITYLSNFRYRPSEQVQTRFDPVTEDFELEVSGLWHEVILYEVPLLALISEAYFRFVDRDWNYDGQAQNAQQKATALLEHGCVFSEFGTRRRRDFKTHDIVMGAIHAAHQAYKTLGSGKGAVMGTSNVYLAMKYEVNAIGTVAHEFFMGVSALEGIKHANRVTLERWYEIYQGALGIALTDTFTTPVFLQDFDRELAEKFTGVRQDSGNPVDFVPLMVNHYKSLGIDPKTKVIVFSDALDVPRAIHLLGIAEKGGIQASFGIGTSFTNDFVKLGSGERSKPLNIVIKLKECNGKRVIKLSDDVLKYSADIETINEFKQELGI